MTKLTFSKLSAAWLKARKQEEERVQAPPPLAVYEDIGYGRIRYVADNFDNLTELIKRSKKLEIDIPNRLRIEVFPAVEDKERFAVYTVGRFRHTEVGGIGTPRIFDLGPSEQAGRFKKQIAEPLSKSFGCQFGHYGGMFQNITLAPITAEQANILIKAVAEFKSDEALPEPSLIRIASATIQRLIK